MSKGLLLSPVARQIPRHLISLPLDGMLVHQRGTGEFKLSILPKNTTQSPGQQEGSNPNISIRWGGFFKARLS